MANEEKNTEVLERKALLQKMRAVPELYVLMSACTKQPYVICDPETFDDEILMFFTEEEARTKGKALLEEKIPVTIVRVEEKQKLLFFTSLFTMGVNAILMENGGEETLLQLEELVRRKTPEEQPEGTVWIENPQLHLTALYYAQEMRRQPNPQPDEAAELLDELLADFKKGKYILAVQREEKGVPLAKMKDGQMYQPIFTDALEFQKFNRENKFRPIAAPADKLAALVVPDAKGVVLNIMSINLPFTINRNPAGAGQAAAGTGSQTPASQGGQPGAEGQAGASAPAGNQASGAQPSAAGSAAGIAAADITRAVDAALAAMQQSGDGPKTV